MSDASKNNASLERVLNQVSMRVSKSETTSLWEKMREEMQSEGPDAAIRYISDELDRCKQDFERELRLLRESSNEVIV